MPEQMHDVVCEHCNTGYRVKASKLGNRAVCKSCSKTFTLRATPVFEPPPPPDPQRYEEEPSPGTRMEDRSWVRSRDPNLIIAWMTDVGRAVLRRGVTSSILLAIALCWTLWIAVIAASFVTSPKSERPELRGREGAEVRRNLDTIDAGVGVMFGAGLMTFWAIPTCAFSLLSIATRHTPPRE